MDYCTEGIVLKRSPLGENDRLLTLFTPERGRLQVVAPGVLRPKSSLRGYTELLMVNHWEIKTGRSLDRIVQVERRQHFPGLVNHLGKWTIAQYWGEVVYLLGNSHTPQGDLYVLLLEHLRRLHQLEKGDPPSLLAHCCHGLFHLLAIAGLAPEVQRDDRGAIIPPIDNPQWRIGLSYEAGRIVPLDALPPSPFLGTVKTKTPSPKERLYHKLSAGELHFLQHLGQAYLPPLDQLWSSRRQPAALVLWARVEGLLRDYCQYHIGQTLRVPPLLETFVPLDF